MLIINSYVIINIIASLADSKYRTNLPLDFLRRK